MGGGYPQGRLTRRTRRRPRCPRAPPRPGAARLPSSRGLGPRRGGSAISERTLCRSRAQPPLPPGVGGGGSLPLVTPLRSPQSPGLAAALPRCWAAEQSSVALGRASASETAGCAPRPQRRTPSSPPGGTVWRASGAAAPGVGAGPGFGLVHSALRRGSRVGPLRGEGGGAARDAGGARGRGETPSPPAKGPHLFSPPQTRLSSPVDQLEVDEFEEVLF